MKPTIERNGDAWELLWDAHGVAIGMERLHEARDELKALVTVESRIDGRVLGPVRLNLLSSESQTRFANACQARVNGLSREVWHALVVQACAIVTKDYWAPTPLLDLSQVDTSVGVEYLIPGLVPMDETTVMYGDGESGKSVLAMRIATSVAHGQVLPWGARPSKPMPVLYLDWETNPRTVAGRLKRIAWGMQTTVPQIHYRQCFRGLSDELPSVREEIAKRGIGLVVVDSIGFAADGALVEDETARRAMNSLRQMSPATRLVVAHVSAEGARQTSGTASPFGSRFFWNGMRSGIEIRKAEEGGVNEIKLGLYHRKANDGEHHKPIGIDVMFDGAAGAIAFVESEVYDSPDLAARTTLSARLRRLLESGSKDTLELAEETDSTIETVGRTLRRMSGVIRLTEGTKARPGTWGLSA